MGSDKEGLSSDEAALRLQRYGPNELIRTSGKPPWKMLLDQFADFMILVLIAAAFIAGFVGEPSDTIAIIVIVILNALIGFVQEYRAQKAMEALRKMAGTTATVVRGGKTVSVAAADIVPGDIVTLEAGNVVPADLRMTEAVNLKIQEASLTGESLPVEKQTECLGAEELALGDRSNMSYRGTHVAYGRGSGVATATGMDTELGKIALMLQEGGEMKTPLQKRLAAFGQKLAVIVLVICAVIFGVGIVRGEEPLMMLLTAISLAVAAIPEALPAVVTISLALGAKKLVRQNALIRKLPAVETLGSVTYICSDKTGTLTQNKMSVEEVYLKGTLRHSGGVWEADPRKLCSGEGGVEEFFLGGLALCNDVRPDVQGELIGEPTETALYTYAGRYGFVRADLETKLPRVAEIPFDAQRKCMTTIHLLPQGGYISFTKGALDTLLSKSDSVLTAQGVQPLEEGGIEKVNESLASGGMRVLCLCMRRWEELPGSLEEAEESLTILGLTGLMDPPREEAAEAIAQCKKAGIRPVMITGDHPLTAVAIARRLGLLIGGGSIPCESSGSPAALGRPQPKN